MRRALVVAAALASAACVRRASLVPDPVVEGRATYRRACASCHGKDARGGRKKGSALGVAPSDLTRLAAHAGGTFPREYVIEVVTGKRDVPGHAREMPIWRERFGPGDSPAEAAAAVYRRQRLEFLASYLATIQQR